jgi:hypothetical protein
MDDPIGKLNVDQFAEKVKAKYPEYKDVDNALLTTKILDKYPEYQDQVELNPVKKKEQSYGGYSSSFSEPSSENQRKIVQPDVVPAIPAAAPGLELPKLSLGNDNNPLSASGKSGGFGDAFQTQISKPMTEQEYVEADAKKLESQRADGVIENAEGFIAKSVIGMAKAGVDAAVGIASQGRSLFRAKDAETPLYNEDGSELAQDDLAMGIQWLNRKSKDLEEGMNTMPLADNTAGRVLDAAASFAPDIAVSMALPEIKIGQWGGIAGKYALEAVTSSFTRTLAIRGGLEAIRQADLQGKDGVDKAIDVAKAVAEKTAEGAVMHGLRELSGAFGKKGVEVLTKAGGSPGILTNGAIGLAANYAIWGAYGTGTAMLHGDDDPLRAGNESGVMGVLFELKGLHQKGAENRSVNKEIAKKFVDADNQIKVETLFRANPESIAEAVKQEGTAEDFHAKGLEYAELAIKESDPVKKSQLITTAQAFKKVADVKQGVEAIAIDKDAWHGLVDNSGMDPIVAQTMKSKIDAIHKDYNPEEVKKSEIAGRITESKQKVKSSKENVTEDPIESARTEVEREGVELQLREDQESLKTIIRNEAHPVSKVLPGDEFYTMDGTKHKSSGRDIESGIIYNETGKSIPYDQVDATRVKSKDPVELLKEESAPTVEWSGEAVKPIQQAVVEATVEPVTEVKPKKERKPKAKKVAEETKPVEPVVEGKIEAPSVKPAPASDPIKEVTPTEPTVKKPKASKEEKAPKETKEAETLIEEPIASKEPVKTEQTEPLLLHKEIDRVTRTGASPEPDLTTKQNYQAVLKKKFTELSKNPPESIHDDIRKFVHTLHEYRNKNRIKSDKVYTEKGSKDQFKGLNYWIDFAESLYAKKTGKSKSGSTQEIIRMRSDWAKEKMPKEQVPTSNADNIVDSKVRSAEKPNTQEKPPMELKPADQAVTPEKESRIKEAPEKNPRKPRVKREKALFEKAIDDLAPDTTPIKQADHEEPRADEIKAEKVDEGELLDTKDGLSQVGYDVKGKSVFVLRENRERYDKLLEGINKKLERIKNDGIPEGSTVQKEEAIVRALKEKLKSFEVKPASFKTQKSESAKQASSIDKAEIKMNKLHQDGRKQARAGQASMGSFGNPDFWVGNTKIIVGAAGSKAIKTARDLKKVYNELVKKQQFDVDFDLLPFEHQKNLLRLVQNEQSRKLSGKTAGELMQERQKDNEAAAKKLKRENSLFSKKGVATLREKLWDYDGNLVKSLHDDGSFKTSNGNSVAETYGEKAERLIKTLPAAYSKAEAKYLEAMSKVYGSGIFGKGKVESLSKGQQHLLSDIALYKRVIELDGKRISDGEELMKHPGGLDIVQAKQRLEELASHDPSIIEKFGKYDFSDLTKRVDEYYNVLQDLVDYRFANGLISRTAYNALKAVKYYSPRVFLKHLVDNDGYYSNKPTIAKTIHSLSDSSEGEIVTNLAKLMADAINIVYETSARNESTKAIADIIEENPEIHWGKTAEYSSDFIKRLKDLQIESTQANPGLSTATGVRDDATSKYKYIEPSFKPAKDGFQLVVYRDGGIKRGFYLKNELAKELEGLRINNNKWLNHVSFASTVTTLATGTNWYFAATNPVRDAAFALFTTDQYSKHFPIGLAQYTGDFISSLKDSFLHKGDYNKYAEQGGGNDYLLSESKLYSGNESALKRDLDKFWDLFAHRIPSTFENAGRLAVRKRALKNLEEKANKDGITVTPEIRKNMEEQASYAALKVLNFSEGGEYTKKYNVIAPFTNVGVIASRNLIRYAKSSPKEFAYKVAQLTGYVAALSAWNNGLINSNDEMATYFTQNISERDKASNFIVMTPMRYTDSDGNLRYLYIKIPKSQDQMIFAGAAEYGSMNMAGVKSYSLEKWRNHRAYKDAQGIVSYLPDGGNLLPPIVKGWLGYKTDYDFFRDEHFTTSSEMASRKPEDQYDMKTPERWKTIAKPFGLSPIKLRGAFKSAIPTNNQWFDIADAIYTNVNGEDTKAVAVRNKAQGTVLDRFEKQLDQVGASEQEKQELYKQLTLEVLSKTPALNRLIKLTAPTVIDEDRDDRVAEEASRSFHETEVMKEAAYEFKHGLIDRNELLEKATKISEDPLIIKKAVGMAKAAILLKRGTPEAFDIAVSGIQSPGGQARLLNDKLKGMNPDKGNKLLMELRETGLFKATFWYEFKKLDSKSAKNKNSIAVQ